MNDKEIISNHLQTNIVTGLTNKQALERLEQYGENIIPGITNNLGSIRTYHMPIVHVRRNGFVEIIAARHLVPGDIVLLQAGTKISADTHLFLSCNLRVKEIIKNKTNILHTGTSIIQGYGEGIVIATGKQTALPETLTKEIAHVSILKTLNHTIKADSFHQWPIDMHMLLVASILNNKACLKNNELLDALYPHEKALLIYAHAQGYDIHAYRRHFNYFYEISFSQEPCTRAIICKEENQQWLIVKGNPNFVLSSLHNQEITTKQKIITDAHELAQQGLDVTLFAHKKASVIDFKQALNDITYLGMIGISNGLPYSDKKTT